MVLILYGFSLCRNGANLTDHVIAQPVSNHDKHNMATTLLRCKQRFLIKSSLRVREQQEPKPSREAIKSIAVPFIRALQTAGLYDIQRRDKCMLPRANYCKSRIFSLQLYVKISIEASIVQYKPSCLIMRRLFAFATRYKDIDMALSRTDLKPSTAYGNT